MKSGYGLFCSEQHGEIESQATVATEPTAEANEVGSSLTDLADSGQTCLHVLFFKFDFISSNNTWFSMVFSCSKELAAPLVAAEGGRDWSLYNGDTKGE